METLQVLRLVAAFSVRLAMNHRRRRAVARRSVRQGRRVWAGVDRKVTGGTNYASGKRQVGDFVL